jgi:steroid delta-isomerase-like uncharacterized protein
MSTEQHKETLRRIYDEVFSKGNLGAVDELMAANYVLHGPGGTELKGPTGFKEFVRTLRAAFPDVQVTVEDMVAEGSEVAHRATLRGSHQGEFMGIPATGRQVEVSITTISRFADGQEVEAWESLDTARIYQQLGAAPEDRDAKVRRIISDAFSKGNTDALSEIVAPDIIFHRPPMPDIRGLEAYKEMIAGLRKAFSDIEFVPDDYIRVGETHACRYTLRGTHTGPMAGGMAPIPPTGRRVTINGMVMIHSVNGKAQEEWEYVDTVGFMQQLGATPPMGRQAA